MTHLKEGDQAPDFTAPDQNGNEIKLSNYRGKKVILYFYPKDNTPGCTNQALNLKENYDKLKSKGYEIIGISTDDVKSHHKFVCKYDLPFTLVADENKEIVNKYGVYGEKKMFAVKYMGTHRKTFIINEEGLIERIIEKVKPKEHANQLAN